VFQLGLCLIAFRGCSITRYLDAPEIVEMRTDTDKLSSYSQSANWPGYRYITVRTYTHNGTVTNAAEDRHNSYFVLLYSIDDTSHRNVYAGDVRIHLYGWPYPYFGTLQANNDKVLLSIYVLNTILSLCVNSLMCTVFCLIVIGYSKYERRRGLLRASSTS
jgi:hypothetical protein